MQQETGLVAMVGQMNPRKTAEIMALMDPGAAERLTAALADRGNTPVATVPVDALPKIQGREQRP